LVYIAVTVQLMINGMGTLEREVESAAKLRCGLSGERDGGHVLDLIDPSSNTGCHPFSEHLGFARSSAGFHEDVL
jgi:hypothetical protein